MTDGQGRHNGRRGRGNALLAIGLAVFFLLIAWFVVEGRRTREGGGAGGAGLNAPEAGAPVAPGGQ